MPGARGGVREFYDELASDYHLIFADWDASMTHQAEVLDKLIDRHLGTGSRRVLDCSCGIGTQAVGLALRGHDIVGSDLSPVAAARAAVEAAARGARLPTAAADMRRLPFTSFVFDVVLCADNSLPHLLSASEIQAALSSMRRVLRDDGLLVITVRDYDELRATKPASTAPQVSETGAVTFQLWRWHDDGERYDLEHFQLIQAVDTWDVRVRRTTYWALTRSQLSGFVAGAGFADVSWHEPTSTGFYQPILTAR